MNTCLALWNNDLASWGLFSADKEDVLSFFASISVNSFFDAGQYYSTLSKLFDTTCVLNYEGLLFSYKRHDFLSITSSSFRVPPHEYLIIKKLLRRHILNHLIDSELNHCIDYLASTYTEFIICNKLQRVLFSETPHTAFDYLFFLVADSLHIPCYALEMVGQFGRGLSYLFDLNNWKILSSMSTSTHSTLKFVSTRSIYRQLISESEVKPYSKQMQAIVNEELLAGRLDNLDLIRNFSDIACYENFVQWVSHKADTRRYLTQHSLQHLSNDHKYSVYFLHLEPESTVTPEGRLFSNQLLAITHFHTVSQSLGFHTIVKEHPDQFKTVQPYSGNSHWQRPEFSYVSRNISFYQSIQQIIGRPLCFLSDGHSLSSILDPSKVCLAGTICGSVGLQTISSGITTLCYGRPWYQGLPNLYTVDHSLHSTISSDTSHLISTQDFLTSNWKNNINILIRILNYLT